MKILLVNNNTKHLAKLHQSLSGYEVEIQDYKPGIKFNYRDKDLIILSGGGGEGRELNDYHGPHELWYEDEIEFVRSCDKPIIGICMGFEVIAAAYGAKIKPMKKGIEKYSRSKTTLKGRKQLGKKKLWQFEAHDYCVKSVPKKHFEVLAKSKTGLEVIKHKNRPVIATQFHPEFPDGTLRLESLVATI